jgi:hypothetical protein
LVLAILLALVTLAVIIVAALGTNRAGKFDPPPFEENAVAGVPDPLPSAFGTITVNPGFVVGACAYPSLEGSELGVYLTSHKNNTCWVKIQIYDEEKRLLGQSGLLQPGEYLPTVWLSEAPAGAEVLHATILAYEPESYYSLGAVNIDLGLTMPK